MESGLKTIRLEGIFELLAPLSHIGETISADAYLNEIPVLQEDGSIEQVFVFNGNAWRGQLRDCAARYLLDRLGGMKVPLPAFHLLFSGGSIGGPQSVDLEQARAFRRVLPLVSLWGGGVGNQLLPGKLKVGECWPCVQETTRLVPEAFRSGRALAPYRTWTCEQSYTRHDDSKDERYRDRFLLKGDADQLVLTGELTGEAPKAKVEKAGPATQMRYTQELLIAGARLYTRIDCVDVTELELGCLVSALDEFAKAPYIGGGSCRGHGLVRLTYLWQDCGARTEPEHFISVGDGQVLLSPPAAEAKTAYDEYLRTAYQQHLDSHQSEIAGVLEAVK